jgi:hypothetical protein
LKHNTSYSFTILRKPESNNFRTKPFEIFHVHILITFFPLDSFSVDIEGYEKKHVYREKCNGGGIVVFFRKWLSQYVEIVKCVADCMIWFKFDFRTKPFEIFHVHILITLFPLDSFSVEFSSHSAAS